MAEWRQNDLNKPDSYRFINGFVTSPRQGTAVYLNFSLKFVNISASKSNFIQNSYSMHAHHNECIQLGGSYPIVIFSLVFIILGLPNERSIVQLVARINCTLANRNANGREKIGPIKQLVLLQPMAIEKS
jgi:hypothetical protein